VCVERERTEWTERVCGQGDVRGGRKCVWRESGQSGQSACVDEETYVEAAAAPAVAVEASLKNNTPVVEHAH
jgi:hypothetical protein